MIPEKGKAVFTKPPAETMKAIDNLMMKPPIKSSSYGSDLSSYFNSRKSTNQKEMRHSSACDVSSELITKQGCQSILPANIKSSTTQASLSFPQSNDYYQSVEAEEDETEPIEDTIELYKQYRKEFEDLKQNASVLERGRYIELLESMVYDLLDQNQCLAENIAELKIEADKRVEVIYEQLGNSALRTEEVMLSLESHEVLLKKFVQRHCCECCGCDMRLMDFQICHGNDCDGIGHFDVDHSTSIPKHCWSYGFQWNSVLNSVQNWFSRNAQLTDFMPKDIYRSTSANFMPLIDGICTRINKLENENDELKYDNQLVRELNGMLSGRKSSIVTTSQQYSVSYEKEYTNNVTRNLQDRGTITNSKRSCSHSSVDSDTLSLNQLFGRTESGSLGDTADLNQDLMTFLSKAGKNDSSGSYYEGEQLLDMNDSCCSESRSDSLASRHELDSGCSTDILPSQADMHSLLSECDVLMANSQLNNSHQLRRAKENEIPDYPTSDISENSDSDNLRHRLVVAERLVPKLYNKLIYYITQRNLLLKQFNYENREREKCKEDVAKLVDSIEFQMKDFEVNSSETNQTESTKLH